MRTVLGVAAGFIIGVVASLLGVAGGELLIPTLVLLFGLDLKLAGSVSLAMSLPTMLVGFARYSRDQAFAVLRRQPHLHVGHGSRLCCWCRCRRDAGSRRTDLCVAAGSRGDLARVGVQGLAAHMTAFQIVSAFGKADSPG